MKTIKYLSIMVMFVISGACDNQDIALYEDHPGVYFSSTFAENYNFIANPHLQVDTFINEEIMITGAATDRDRYFNAKIVEGEETNALEGQFELLQGVVPANSYTGYLPIQLKRSIEMDTGVFIIEYALVASKDFPMIDLADKTCKISCTAGFVKPPYWWIFEWDYGSYSNNWFKFILSVCKDYEFYAEASLMNMTQNDYDTHYDFVSMVKLALKEYNDSHDEPLKHDDGTVVVMP